MSIRAIADRLDVSTSSVSLWVRDIALTADQEAALQANDPVRNGRLIGTQAYQERCRRRRREAQEHGRALARLGDPVHRGGGSSGSRCRPAVSARRW
jgi:transposase